MRIIALCAGLLLASTPASGDPAGVSIVPMTCKLLVLISKLINGWPSY